MPDVPKGVMYQVPIHVTARTPEELTLAMLQLNLKDGVKNSFFDIQRNGKEWIAWYYKDIGRMVKDKLNKDLEDARRPKLPKKNSRGPGMG